MFEDSYIIQPLPDTYAEVKRVTKIDPERIMRRKVAPLETLLHRRRSKLLGQKRFQKSLNA